jgi:hypothetical protein
MLNITSAKAATQALPLGKEKRLVPFVKNEPT